MSGPKLKIAIVVSHPIQHFCPQYVSYSQLDFCEIKVFFGSAMGMLKYHDKSFGKEIAWSNLNLDKFEHIFLNGDQILAADKNLDAPNLEHELEKYAPKILITYGYFQKLQQRAQRWANNNNVIVAYISDSEQKRKRPFITELLKKYYVRSQFGRIQYFLSVGDANEDYYKYYGVHDRQIIRNPFSIDVLLFEKVFADKAAHNKDIRAQYQISDNSIVLSVIGKLESFKRQQDIIDAMEKLLHTELPIVLLIIGTGPNEAVLRQKAAGQKNKNIIFTGFVAPDILASYYAATDIYIHVSDIDAHSLSISEAIFMGCPLVVSDTCGSYGANDDVQEGKNGFVFKTGDIEALAGILNYLILHPHLIKELGKYSRQAGLHNQKVSHALGLKALTEIVEINNLTVV